MYTDSELSDEAPEDVTFQQSREITSKAKQNQSQRDRNLRQDRKLRNKKREELFNEQKKAKVARLAVVRLPDEVLDTLPDEDTKERLSLDALPQQSKHIEFSSDDETDDVDSGINSTITSKVSAKDVEAIKARTYSSALVFKAMKELGCHDNIKRQSAREKQFLREKRRATRLK